MGKVGGTWEKRRGEKRGNDKVLGRPTHSADLIGGSQHEDADRGKQGAIESEGAAFPQQWRSYTPSLLLLAARKLVAAQTLFVV